MIGLHSALSPPIQAPIGSGFRSQGNARRRTLELDMVTQGPVLDADFTSSNVRTWVNDPAYADHVGRYRSGPGLSDRALSSLLTFSRTGKAWQFDRFGALTEVATGNLRHNYSAAGLPDGFQIEQQSTNAVRNPRAEGATAGAPGTVPTNWGISSPVGGITREIVGVGTENGIPGVYLRIAGLPTATAAFEVAPEAAFANLPAANGQTWTSSVYVRLTAGSLTGFGAITFEHLERGGASSPGMDVAFTPTGTLARRSNAYANVVAGTTGLTVRLNIRVTNAVAVDGTFFVGGFQVEQAPFATSLILPNAGTPAASTRNADNLTGALSSTWWNAAAGTFVVEAMLPALPGSGTAGLLVVDDGTLNNRISLRAQSVVNVATVVGGGVTAFASVAAATAATPFRAALAYDAAGVSLSMNGAAPIAGAGALPAGLTTLRIGANGTGPNSPLNGFIRSVTYFPFRLTNAKLQAASVVGADLSTI